MVYSFKCRLLFQLLTRIFIYTTSHFVKKINASNVSQFFYEIRIQKITSWVLHKTLTLFLSCNLINGSYFKPLSSCNVETSIVRV